MIKGKTPEEIRKLFNIVSDFTPEEEVRRPVTSTQPGQCDSPFRTSGSNPKGERVGGGPINAPNTLLLAGVATVLSAPVETLCDSIYSVKPVSKLREKNVPVSRLALD